MTYRPLFVLADAEALERAALDRWFGNAGGWDHLPEYVIRPAYEHSRRVRDAGWSDAATADATAVAWDA